MTGTVQDDAPPAGGRRRRIAIIFNPVAGSPRRRESLAQAVRTLRRAGWQVKLRATTAAGDAARSATTIATAGTFDAILAAGGDGTLSDVAHGLAVAPVAKLPALACLPLGTANVLAHEIGLPLDAKGAAEVAARGRTVMVPMARANDRHFLLMAGAGFDAHVVCGVSSALKKRIGKLAYVWEMLRQLGRFPFRRYRVTVNGIAHEVASVIVARGHYYGGSYVLAPDARLSDDALHVCLFERGGRFGVLLYSVAMALGWLKHAPGFRIVRAQRVRVEGIDGEPVQADGDTAGKLPVDIAMTGRSIRLVVP